MPSTSNTTAFLAIVITSSTYLSGETNGDRDETLDSATVVSGAAEIYAAWKQLAAAGVYLGSFSGLNGSGYIYHHSVIGTNIPGSKAISKAGYTFYYVASITGNASYWNGNYGNLLWFGKERSDSLTLDPVLKPVDAFNIDKKIDDGIPGIGKVRTAYANIGSCATSGSVYSVPSSSAYYITNDSVACALVFLLDY